MKIKQLLKKFYPIIAVLAVAFILMIWLSSMKRPPQRTNGMNTIQSVAVVDVKVEDIQIRVPIIGKLVAQNHVQIFSEVQGVLEKRDKEFLEGVSYKKGETLLSINSQDTEYNLMSQRSSLLTQIAQILPEMQYDFPESATQWEQYLADFDVEKEIQPLPEPKNEREKYYISGKGIYQTYYNIKNLEYTFSKYDIKAPFNGAVVSSEIKPGTLVMPGQPLGEYMSTFTYDLETSVTVAQSSLIEIGDKVVLNTKSVDDVVIGIVTRINDNVDPQTLMVNVYITVKGSELWEGMYLTGDIYSSANIVATELPRSIITNANSVFTVQDNIVIEKPIEIIALHGDTAVVAGLTDGELLSTKSQDIYNGQKVNTL